MKGNMKLITYWRWDNISSSTSPQVQHKISRLKALTQELLVQRLEPFHREIVSCGIQRYVKKLRNRWDPIQILMGTLLQPLRSYTRSSVVLVSGNSFKSPWLHLTHSNRSTINGLQRAKGKTCGRTLLWHHQHHQLPLVRTSKDVLHQDVQMISHDREAHCPCLPNKHDLRNLAVKRAQKKDHKNWQNKIVKKCKKSIDLHQRVNQCFEAKLLFNVQSKTSNFESPKRWSSHFAFFSPGAHGPASSSSLMSTTWHCLEVNAKISRVSFKVEEKKQTKCATETKKQHKLEMSRSSWFLSLTQV